MKAGDAAPVAGSEVLGSWLYSLLVFNKCVEWAEVQLPEPREAIAHGSIGYAYRYRKSRKIAAERAISNDEVEDEIQTPKNSIPHGSIGYAHRYRLSRKIQDEQKAIEKKKEVKPVVDIKVPLSEIYPSEVLSVGYEHRYRRSRKMVSLGMDPVEVENRKAQYLLNNFGVDLIKEAKKVETKREKQRTDPRAIQQLDYNRLTDKERRCGYEFRYRRSKKFSHQIPEYLKDTYDEYENRPPWWIVEDNTHSMLMEAISRL
ncbi:hypothetical protein ACOME3_005022 [Neoechinorhynchus agilis]